MDVALETCCPGNNRQYSPSSIHKDSLLLIAKASSKQCTFFYIRLTRAFHWYSPIITLLPRT